MRRALAAALALAAVVATDAFPCTTFCMNVDGRVVFGQNYDWETSVGRIMINKRLMSKESYTLRPVRWVSRFASITVNQYGREFPCGGMNEAGLVVALMDLDVAQYPEVDERPSAGVLDWIQYQLDLAANIDDVVSNASSIRVATGSRKIHFLIADRTGRAVTIEYIGGMLVTHRDETLPVAVLANSSYDASLAYLRTINGFGGTQPVPNSPDSLHRFARVASMIRTTPAGADAVTRAFQILDSVRQTNTRWSIVYEPATTTMYLRTDQNRTVRWASLASFDGECASAVKLFDMNAPQSGDLAPLFTDYTFEANIALVNQAYDETSFLRNATEQSRLDWALHGDQGVCVTPKRLRAVRR
jgi:penicillin V acylase-like amidase (Ntn superfamily)